MIPQQFPTAPTAQVPVSDRWYKPFFTLFANSMLFLLSNLDNHPVPSSIRRGIISAVSSAMSEADRPYPRLYIEQFP